MLVQSQYPASTLFPYATSVVNPNLAQAPYSVIMPDTRDPYGVESLLRHVRDADKDTIIPASKHLSAFMRLSGPAQERVPQQKASDFPYEKGNVGRDVMHSDVIVKGSNIILWPTLGATPGYLMPRLKKQKKPKPGIVDMRLSRSRREQNISTGNASIMGMHTRRVNTELDFSFSDKKEGALMILMVTAEIGGKMKTVAVRTSDCYTISDLKLAALKEFCLYNMKNIKNKIIENSAMAIGGCLLDNELKISTLDLKNGGEIFLLLNNNKLHLEDKRTTKSESENENENNDEEDAKAEDKKEDSKAENEKREDAKAEEEKKDVEKPDTKAEEKQSLDIEVEEELKENELKPVSSSKKGLDWVQRDYNKKQLPLEGKQKSYKVLAKKELIPVLSKSNYKISPDIASLSRMSAEELVKVQNLTIENSHGRIVWEGETDVLGLNLDELVSIECQDIAVYPDDSVKPPIGEKLNKPALLTFFNIKPSEEFINENGNSPNAFIELLEAECFQQNTEFVEYLPYEKSWTIRVRHFTRYGIKNSRATDKPPENEDEAGERRESPAKEEPARRSLMLPNRDSNEPTDNELAGIGANEEEKEDMKLETENAVEQEPGSAIGQGSGNVVGQELANAAGQGPANTQGQEPSTPHAENNLVGKVSFGKPQPQKLEKMEEMKNPPAKQQSGAFFYDYDMIEPAPKKIKDEDARPEKKEASPDSDEANQNLPARAFARPESSPAEAKRASFGNAALPVCDTKFLQQDISCEQKLALEEAQLNKAGEKHWFMAQSFRACWGPGGELIKVGGINKKTGNYMMSVHQVMIHPHFYTRRKDTGELLIVGENTRSSISVLYEAQFKALFDCASKSPPSDIRLSFATSIPIKSNLIQRFIGTILQVLAAEKDRLEKLCISLKELKKPRFGKSEEGDDHIEIMKCRNFYANEIKIWSLFHILFTDATKDIMCIAENKTKTDYIDSEPLPDTTNMLLLDVLRKNNLLRWLELVVSWEEDDRAENNKRLLKHTEKLQKIYHLLTSGLFEKASEMCFRLDDVQHDTAKAYPKYGLGTLLAQFPSLNKSLIKKEVKSLRQSFGLNINVMFPEEMHIYEELAGSATSTPFLDWKRAMLFLCTSNYNDIHQSSVRAIFKKFLKQMSSNLDHRAHPVSKYANSDDVYDFCFNLLGVYSCIGERFTLEKLLNAKGYTGGFTEKRLLFLIYVCLNAVMDHGVEEKYCEDLRMIKLAIQNYYPSKFLHLSLITGVIGELENLGLWHWAIFVLLQYGKTLLGLNDTLLKSVLHQIIGRNIEIIVQEEEENAKGSSNTDEKLSFVKYSLFLSKQIPDPEHALGCRIINTELGIYYMNNNRPADALAAFEKAEDYAMISKILREYFIPLIILHKFDDKSQVCMLEEKLTSLEAHFSEIKGWASNCGVVCEYFKLRRQLKEIKKNPISMDKQSKADLFEATRAYGCDLAKRKKILKQDVIFSAVLSTIQSDLLLRTWELQCKAIDHSKSCSIPALPLSNLFETANAELRGRIIQESAGVMSEVCLNYLGYEYLEKA